MWIPDTDIDIATIFEGWTARECPDCKCVQPIRVLDCQHRWDDMGENWYERQGWLLRCGFCRNEYLHPVRPELHREWEAEDDLQALVDRTNPELGRIDPRTEHSDAELRALLRGIEHHAHRMPFREAGAGMLPGAIVGGTCGLVLGLVSSLLLFLSNAPDQAAFPVLSGCCVTGLVSGVLLGVRLRKRRLRSEWFVQQLQEACATHQLILSQIRDACLSGASNQRKFLPLLNASPADSH
ncbi:MAG: hypothetical protein KAI66_02135 [Lentisphaeria bacterium]|nr:hypothetical protein [Lentisphaeria bacterium]